MKSYLENFDSYDDHEIVGFHHDRASGVQAIVAIHHKREGVGCGGIRYRNYDSVRDSVEDVLALSRAMTYKTALAGLPVGGAKSVVLAGPHSGRREDLMSALGRMIESYGGAYIGAPDMGIATADLEVVAEQTDHVVGFRQEAAPYTALGAFRAIEGAASWKFGTGTLEGMAINVEGVGNVGRELVRLLSQAGAEIRIHDVDEDRARAVASEFTCSVTDYDDLLDSTADIFVPAAIGGTVNAATVARLRVGVIAGPANNQLESKDVHSALEDKQILFIPDFVASAGGVIAGVNELDNFDHPKVIAQIDRIRDTTLEVVRHAAETKMNTEAAALDIARERL